MSIAKSESRKPRPFKGISDEKSDFVLCIILHMLLPLLPLIFETWKTSGHPSEAILAISTSMYSIAIGMSSRNKAIFAICVFVSILFSIVFGMLNVTEISASQNSDSPPLDNVSPLSIITIAVIFFIHACERYNKHVVECIPFWDFGTGDID